MRIVRNSQAKLDYQFLGSSSNYSFSGLKCDEKIHIGNVGKTRVPSKMFNAAY